MLNITGCKLGRRTCSNHPSIRRHNSVLISKLMLIGIDY